MAERSQILTLDGGGIRGLFSAALLAAIEEDLGTHVDQHFDLIAGTSTGGIVAIALGLGIRPRAIVDFYLQSPFQPSWHTRCAIADTPYMKLSG